MDWTQMAVGLGLGAGVSVIFFAGLWTSVRLARKIRAPVPFLLVSATIRIALVVGAAYVSARVGPWALAGFAAAFVLVRQAALRLAGEEAGQRSA